MFEYNCQPEYVRNSQLLPHLNDRIWIKTGESPRYTLPLEVMWAGYGIKDSSLDRDQQYITYRVIVLVTAGEMIYTQRGEEVTGGPGDVCFIDKGAAFRERTGPAGFAHIRFVAFTGSMADALTESTGLWENRVAHIDSSERVGKVKVLCKEINRLMGDPHENRDLDLSSTVYRLILEIGQSRAARAYPAAVVKVLELLENSLDRFVTTQEITSVAALGKMQLSRLFARHFSLPPLKYFAHLKMQHARNLFLTTGLCVKEVAARVGYADPRVFSAQFRKVVGESPSEVRKRDLL